MVCIATAFGPAEAYASSSKGTRSESPHGEWRLIGGDANGTHFSALDEINSSNVKRLGVAWYVDMPTADGMVGTPLVADGVIYQSGAHSIIYANSLRDGRLLWTFDPKVAELGTVLSAAGGLTNRGLALWRDLVIVGTGDCRLVAVDRKTGLERWQAQVCVRDGQRGIAGAPRVGGNKVFIGDSNGDTGTRRCDVDAFDARTGKHLWRFYTVPGDPAKGFESAVLARAAKTWGAEWWQKVGAGCVWDAITYDPQLNLLYVGAGGPAPFNPKERGAGRGDELFTNSVIALNADTGAYAWHYQVTPDDAWNFEPDGNLVVADLRIGGHKRRVVMEAPKNGFFYVLDARTGRLISANNFVPVNWASRIDLSTGRPVELPQARYYDNPDGVAVVSPGDYGAHGWEPMSYSDRTGLVYIPAMVSKQRFRAFGEGSDADTMLDSWKGRLIAWDPLSESARWSMTFRLPWEGGVLSTAGNLVFQGTGRGDFRAYRAGTGEILWSMPVGSGVWAAPVTVSAGGVQLVIIAAGSGTASITARTLSGPTGVAHGPARLIAFKLDGTGALPVEDASLGPIPRPPRGRASPALVRRGAMLFGSCELCHGQGAVAAPVGSVPDLRRASAEIYRKFDAIVRGGLLASAGMPSFGEALTPQDVAALKAYVLDRAWSAFDAQHGRQQKIH